MLTVPVRSSHIEHIKPDLILLGPLELDVDLARAVKLQPVPGVIRPRVSVITAAPRCGGSPLARQLLLMSPVCLDFVQFEKKPETLLS